MFFFQEQNFSVTLSRAFQAIGILYSDLGTSPLYVYTNAFNAVGIAGHIDILGALSIIIYTLTLILLIKYVIILQRSNSNVEDDIKGHLQEEFLLELICFCTSLVSFSWSQMIDGSFYYGIYLKSSQGETVIISIS